MKLILSILLLMNCVFPACAQNDTLNQTDVNGLKQGYWISYGKDFPEKGYPVDGKVEEGFYINGKKNGEWKFYHRDGKTLRLVGNFKDNRPTGPYTKIGLSGGIVETGTYTGGKQSGSFKTYYESGCLAHEKTFNSEGREEGWTIFYYDNCDTSSHDEHGSVERKFQRTNGKSIGTAERYWPSGCLKELVYYGADGMIINSEVFSDDCPDSLRTDCKMNSERISRLSTPTLVPAPIGDYDPGDDYKGANTLYNKCDEIIMQGYFKDGQLWEGRFYKYDSDCILLKIEIWKEGKYFKDVPIEVKD